MTNRQYRLRDATHNSRLEHGDFLQFSHEERGYSLDEPTQPVARVSWYEATEFCRWLSEKTGRSFTLPTEAQWEHACRAGTDTPLAFGGLNDDFSNHANLVDARCKKVDSFEPWKLPVGAIPSWRPADDRFDDRFRVASPVGSFQPNTWGLHDMHGNVAEWTRSLHRSYPSSHDDRNDPRREGRRVVRGGSWYDRPKHARSAYRRSHWPYQKIYDVGFRVVCDITEDEAR